MRAQSLSRVWLSVTPWTVACQAPLSMEFSGQEYWTWLPFHPAVDPLDPGIKLVSPVSSALVGRFFTTEPPGKPINWMYYTLDKNTMFSTLGSHRVRHDWSDLAAAQQQPLRNITSKFKEFLFTTLITPSLVLLNLSLYLLLPLKLQVCSSLSHDSASVYGFHHSLVAKLLKSGTQSHIFTSFCSPPLDL